MHHDISGLSGALTAAINYYRGQQRYQLPPYPYGFKTKVHWQSTLKHLKHQNDDMIKRRN